MMTSRAIRQTFLDFFSSKQHAIVPSAPMVVKNDPTLMFTNAGMNQFKDIFLGNSPAKSPRIADTQKCLRVSGKHNDLEEVGLDTYHHTMFEMLGNWSFGDYFKEDAIAWAWELLTEVYKLPKDRLYVTVFEGDAKEQLAFDQDAYDFWKKWIAEDRILRGNKKDNFWEMGESGPCGPCSEIHIDLRSDAERAKTDGKALVNASHPQVIEIWNNVFMEFNRRANGSLEPLPAKHVDTGMGFERLCMALQGKTSNYDTDVFQPLIRVLADEAKTSYGKDEKMDIAMRVAADHIRAIAFAIADGQLPSNNKAGYVIRRILRRAVRYGYTFLNFREPFLHRLVPVLAEQFDGVFPELIAQQAFISKVIQEEEASFFRTLDNGIKNFHNYVQKGKGVIKLEDIPDMDMEDRVKYEVKAKDQKMISGFFAFELFDTYGFPIDLTQLMAREIGWTVDMDGFDSCLEQQKNRSRAASAVDTGDWTILREGEETEFLAYDHLSSSVEIMKYRKVKAKDKEHYQLVFNRTPFYAESGGQVGDSGSLTDENSKAQIRISDTQKENNLIIHFADALPLDPVGTFLAEVDASRRELITSNHSATHLMHAALREVLGKHVAQKGSLVNEEITRFDFSHFAKLTEEELARIEDIVNEKLRLNIPLQEKRNFPIEEAKKLGAMALFGEKYGEFVRVVTFDKEFSVEFCGGTHVKATGQIGLFKILSESAVAAGVRRVEAITNRGALNYVNAQLLVMQQAKALLKAQDLSGGIEKLMEENIALKKEVEQLLHDKVQQIKQDLLTQVQAKDGLNFLSVIVQLPSAAALKNLSFELKAQVTNLFLVLGAEIEGKPQLSVMVSEELVKEKKMDAGKIVRELAKEIQGGGGGQAFYATAGGKHPAGLKAAIEKASTFII